MKHGRTGIQLFSLAGAPCASLTSAGLFLLNTMMKIGIQLLVLEHHKGPLASSPREFSVCCCLCSLCVILPSEVFSDCRKANDLCLSLLSLFLYKVLCCFLCVGKNSSCGRISHLMAAFGERSLNVKGPATADTIGNYYLDSEALNHLQLCW